MKSAATPKIRILLIGAGRAGSMLLQLFRTDPSIHVVGVVDQNPGAPGLLSATIFIPSFKTRKLIWSSTLPGIPIYRKSSSV